MGEGNVFSLFTSGGGGSVRSSQGGVRSSRRGGGGVRFSCQGGVRSVSRPGGGQHLAPSCGQYASCVHAGGLSCYMYVCNVKIFQCIVACCVLYFVLYFAAGWGFVVLEHNQCCSHCDKSKLRI